MIKFGYTFKIHGELKRVTQYVHEDRNKSWEKIRYTNSGTKEVIIIGKRTLTNGTTHYEDYENVYSPSSLVSAYLVQEIGNMKNNPFYISIDCIEPKED
tara:strand:+ start:1102 stop:1398 length:297 start_codon:yes stop_codon:yes gene_type:complete